MASFRLLLKLTCAAAILAGSTTARAQDGPGEEAEARLQAEADAEIASQHADSRSRMTVDVTLYGWLAGTTGEFTPFTGAPTLEFENSFSEVLKDLDAAFFASAHARKDRLILLADISYASLSREGLVPPGIPADGKLTQFSLTAAAGARVIDHQHNSVDLLVGGRLWKVDGSVDVPLAGVSVSPEKTFVDPIVAVRAVSEIAPRLSILGYADLGGFGVGSEFTYQLVGTLNYRLGQSYFLSAGYRHLSLDYEDGGTVLEGSMTGPMIGITKRF